MKKLRVLISLMVIVSIALTACGGAATMADQAVTSITWTDGFYTVTATNVVGCPPETCKAIHFTVVVGELMTEGKCSIAFGDNETAQYSEATHEYAAAGEYLFTFSCTKTVGKSLVTITTTTPLTIPLQPIVVEEVAPVATEPTQ